MIVSPLTEAPAETKSLKASELSVSGTKPPVFSLGDVVVAQRAQVDYRRIYAAELKQP